MNVLIKFTVSVAAVLFAAQAFGQQLIPFQARLTDGGGTVVSDGVYSMNFNVYDTATAGTTLWTETHSTVSVTRGVVNVILGSLTPFNDPNNTVNFYTTSGDRFIGISIGTGQEMVPRHQLIPSFHAVTADLAVNADTAENANNLGGNLPAHYASVSQHTADMQAINVQFTGAIVAFSGSCPTGWLLADGTAGTPNLLGRFLRGELTGSPASLDFGGNDNAIIPKHNHSVNPPQTNTINGGGSHGHGINNIVTVNGPFVYGIDPQSGSSPSGKVMNLSSGTHNHAVNIPAFNSADAGVSVVGANIPKYYEVIYCVKQ